ncbi:unnamed protein product [Didymodactylos carnosus]|uniref:MACPF domain-containing protein n=1 Tax=Didymodactylos carnosus TaxID=1234261 RepID=A0A8S2G3F3_9BILA|nr:unnamed protein product [Didymodactylos carnosus]CAF4398628.1 unnamed protein product [Didymodactylos carnosus]
MFCPSGSGSKVNVTSKKLKSSTESEPVDSPNSVGMTIDISTGALLLSVLKLSRGIQKRTAKESQYTGLIPPELISTQLQSSSNEKTTVTVPGSWTGGQLAGVYEKYFKDHHAMATTYYLKILYTTTFNINNNNSNLKLNKYAQRDIVQLTDDFNENLYQSLSDAWGTHVIVSIKVGGMNEQQIQFKNCIRYTTKVSDGLIKTILEGNLEQELLEK